MKRSFFATGLAALLTVGASGMAAAADAPQTITVFAAASLTEAFTAAGAAFTKKTGIAVTFNFAGSDTLATQLKEGAPADVFASANLKQMAVANDAGLLDGSAQTFAKNRLVVVTPKGATAVKSAADLAKSGIKVVLAATSVPVGGYSRATFAKLAGANGYPADFSAAVERNVVSNELDVKAVVTKIALGEGDAGVVYSTDVTPAVAPKLDVLTFPAGVTPDIEYPIAAIKHAANAKGAQAFIAFIRSPEGQAFLKARGFVAP